MTRAKPRRCPVCGALVDAGKLSAHIDRHAAAWRVANNLRALPGPYQKPPKKPR